MNGIPARPARLDARGLGEALLRLTPILALYVVYTVVRWVLADRGPSVGPENARRLMDWERALGLDWEVGIQRFALRHDAIVQLANWYYAAAFLPVLVAAAVLASWRAPQTFLRWRRIFAFSLLLALVGFALFPVAPPRLLPAEAGFVDTLMAYGPQYYGNASGSSLFNAYGRLPSMVNLYAAMPSMHVAWSTVAGVLLTIVVRRRWMRAVALLHPLVMAFAVVVTANHFVLDIAGGLAVLAAAVAIEIRLAARAPERAPLLLPPVRPEPIRTLELEHAYSD